jgi:hypothetical protein
VIVEDEHFAAFHRYTRPWQIRPWQRQQIIKLNAPALTAAPFVLTLDPDVVARRPMTRELLVSGAARSSSPRSVPCTADGGGRPRTCSMWTPAWGGRA